MRGSEILTPFNNPRGNLKDANCGAGGSERSRGFLGAVK